MVRFNETERKWLFELLRDRSFERRRVVLASGRESDFFIDCKQAVLTAEGHSLVGSLMFDTIEQAFTGCEAVAGVELGGCPLASAVSMKRWRSMARKACNTGSQLTPPARRRSTMRTRIADESRPSPLGAWRRAASCAACCSGR